MISQTYDLNLIPSQIPVTIHCSQYDDGSRTFVFNLYEGASAFTIPAGASATFSGVKPDGLGFQYGCSITGASQVSVDVALQMTAVAGDCPCKVTVYDTDSNVLGSALCVLDVERHPLQDDTVISDSDIPLVQEAVNWAAQFQPTDFVQKNQGVAQAGKVLGIGADGMVTPTDISANIDAEDVGYDGIVPDSENVEEAIGKIYVRAITSYRMVDTLDTTMADEDFIPFKDESIGGAKNITLSDFVDTISPNFYRVTDSAETTIDDADYVPFYDTSASAKKKITWGNLMNKFQVSIREQGCINGSLAKGIEWDVDELMTLVRAGEFDKFAIGDYIKDANTSIEFAIAAKNHYPAWAFSGGSTKVNHIVLMPITGLATRYKFNSTATNAGGYAGSLMPSNMVTEYNKLSATIRGYCRKTRIVENNKSGWAWADREMRLPTATEVFGYQGWASGNVHANGSPFQLPLCQSGLFRYVNDWYWLLDPSSDNTSKFCVCSQGNSGFSYQIDAHGDGLVRPLIVLA